MSPIVSLHPMFVHFPIALLSLYAGLELITLHPRLRHNTTLYYIKLFLLICGTLGSMVASSTGEGVEHQMPRSILIERHSFFAGMSQNAFIVLTVLYLIRLFLQEKARPQLARVPQNVVALLSKIAARAQRLYVYPILALFGLFAVTITGALGGAIVHGAQIDPFVQWAVQVFGG